MHFTQKNGYFQSQFFVINRMYLILLIVLLLDTQTDKTMKDSASNGTKHDRLHLLEK